MTFYNIKGNYFNGQYHLPKTEGPHAVENIIKRPCPSDTSTTLWEMPVDFNHVEPLIESVNTGYQIWRKTSLDDRIAALKRYQEQVLSIKDDIAEAIALESGKPLWEAKGEVQSVIGKVDVTINESLPRVNNVVIPEVFPKTNGVINYKPIGPCFVIGPFNYPCHLANTQILSALITGNSVIFKPSQKTAYSAQLLIDCFDRADFPKGVINLSQGNGEMASRILKEKSIKGIYFTGSKEVGIKILSNTYHDVSKLVALELGGKNTAIVHQDADFDFTVQELLKSSFLTTGQRCTSTAVIAIHKSLEQNFIEKFHNLAKKLIVDHPIEHEKPPFMGPLVDKQALDSYLLFMGMAKREGIEEIMRGKHLDRKHKGHYVSPSIHYAKTLNEKSHFLSSEIFGPNCTIIPYDNIEEAIEISNFNEYGLANAIFTKDQGIYEQCVQDIESGVINLNRSTAGASPKLPFGGVKNSGNHRPASVAMIDSCVYPQAGLTITETEAGKYEDIVGLELD